ncbi:MAG: YheV family putative metal-binding protein [Porticoccaceae bacterium]|nr:YheV family putative metal-binding protein [Porticoccaceae bacterium]
MTFSTKKRFIAGVVCPKCSQIDKIRAFSEDDIDYRECVSCGFKDQIRIASAPREIDTRVNKSTETVSEQPRKVRLIDPGKTKQ